MEAEARARARIAPLERKVAERLEAYHEAHGRLELARAELKGLVDERVDASTARPRVDWAAGGSAFEWSERLDTTLRSLFRIERFRPLQRKAINATLSGRNALVLMPTGGGKSIVFMVQRIAGNKKGEF
ncbi:hypothetical protein T492DRAFT_865269 [Pavlovales sp. CCMP2436]|nr:hypothetical protein T492DRAFT_865269 [Pavlovales sp. CCMP2436]